MHGLCIIAVILPVLECLCVCVVYYRASFTVVWEHAVCAVAPPPMESSTVGIQVVGHGCSSTAVVLQELSNEANISFLVSWWGSGSSLLWI